MYHFHCTVVCSCICLTLWHEGYDYTQFIVGDSGFIVTWWYNAPVLSLRDYFSKTELFPIVEYDLAPECQGLYCNKSMGLTRDLTQHPQHFVCLQGHWICQVIPSRRQGSLYYHLELLQIPVMLWTPVQIDSLLGYLVKGSQQYFWSVVQVVSKTPNSKSISALLLLLVQ